MLLCCSLDASSVVLRLNLNQRKLNAEFYNRTQLTFTNIIDNNFLSFRFFFVFVHHSLENPFVIVIKWCLFKIKSFRVIDFSMVSKKVVRFDIILTPLECSYTAMHDVLFFLVTS